MRILGIDTSGYANAIGIVDGSRVLADYTFEAKTDSLAKIIMNIELTLKSAALTMDEVDGFGVGLGPGSWTGIRIGVTVGKILAYSRKKPVAGVATLSALAYEARDAPSLICAVISVGTKDAIYAAFYQAENGIMSQVGDYYIGEVGGLARVIREPVVLVGSRAQNYVDAIGHSSVVRVVETMPKGAAVALLAGARLEKGESDDALALAPLYLKESTAKACKGRYLSSSKSG